MDLHLSISNGFVSSKIYDKRDDFDFDIVNFSFLDGDVPRRPSYGVYISQPKKWNPLDTKLKVYKAVVLSILLYAFETWTVYQRHAKKLNHFHLSCLRKILKIRWQDKIPDTEFLKKAKMQSVHTLLKLAQLRWTDHVTRMPDERLPKKVL